MFRQGQPATAVFYIDRGRVKVTVLSEGGKEAVIAILEAGAFVGEGCLVGQPVRTSTASALTDAVIEMIPRDEMLRALSERPVLAARFLSYVLLRNIRIEEDLADQIFNPAERRLARRLLLLAHDAKPARANGAVPKISQETLAEMVGTTRSRINFFMNKFRKLGFIEYDRTLKIHASLLHAVLDD